MTQAFFFTYAPPPSAREVNQSGSQSCKEIEPREPSSVVVFHEFRDQSSPGAACRR